MAHWGADKRELQNRRRSPKQTQEQRALSLTMPYWVWISCGSAVDQLGISWGSGWGSAGDQLGISRGSAGDQPGISRGSAVDQLGISCGSRAVDQPGIGLWISCGSAVDQLWISCGSGCGSAVDQLWISWGSAVEQGGARARMGGGDQPPTMGTVEESMTLLKVISHKVSNHLSHTVLNHLGRAHALNQTPNPSV